MKLILFLCYLKLISILCHLLLCYLGIHRFFITTPTAPAFKALGLCDSSGRRFNNNSDKICREHRPHLVRRNRLGPHLVRGIEIFVEEKGGERMTHLNIQTSLNEICLESNWNFLKECFLGIHPITTPTHPPPAQLVDKKGRRELLTLFYFSSNF